MKTKILIKKMKMMLFKLHIAFKKLKYLFHSNNKIVGNYKAYQPIVVRGKGKITFGDNVNIGVVNSPLFLNTYAYIEARHQDSNIILGNNIHINNSFSIVSEKKVIIKNDVFIGYNCSIVDSNFHDLNLNNRKKTDPSPEEVIVGNNVFIGNDVSILKGVEIGDNCVVASGAIVTKSFKSNLIIGGVPAKIIKTIA